jgi:hypothetical protein
MAARPSGKPCGDRELSGDGEASVTLADDLIAASASLVESTRATIEASRRQMRRSMQLRDRSRRSRRVAGRA